MLSKSLLSRQVLRHQAPVRMSTAAASYPDLIRQLYKINMYNQVKLGLDNMIALNDKLGSPMTGIPIVHITGTNGKGSVAYKIARSLSNNGLRTGLFVSPHIASFKERVQVDNQLLTDEDVQLYLPKLFAICEQEKIPATFFELTTALAFLKFRASQCEAVVLEVGLGGRLDATSIVTPVLSIITSIQLDHMKILGDTIEKIAVEKAGIIKPQVDVIIGPQCPRDIFQSKAQSVQAPLHQLSNLLSPQERRWNQSTHHYDDTDDLNSDISYSALKLLQGKGIFGSKSIDINSAGVQSALQSRPPCRFEIIQIPVSKFPSYITANKPVTVILDIAHNIEAVKALAQRMRRHYPNTKLRIILAMSADKDISACLYPLLDLIPGTVEEKLSRFYCTEAQHPRAMYRKALKQLLTECSGSHDVTLAHDEDIKDVLWKAALPAAAQAAEPEIVLVCGTAFMMAEIRSQLGIIEPRDGNYLSGDDKNRDAQEYFGEAKK